MTAEEKLKEWYKACEPTPIERDKDGIIQYQQAYSAGMYLTPEHIDLIANLVVEVIRLTDDD